MTRIADTRYHPPMKLGATLLFFLIASPATAADLTGIARVVDGATLSIDGRAIRIDGIAVPQRTEPGGPPAAAALRVMVEGKVVTCGLTGRVRQLREVGRCRSGGRDIAADMIAAGYARDCPRWSGGRYRAEEAAAGYGLSSSFPLPCDCETEPAQRKDCRP